MKRNLELVNSIIILVIMIMTLAILIVSNVNAKQKVIVTCDCDKKVEAALSEIVDTYKNSKVQTVESDTSNSETTNSSSEISTENLSEIDSKFSTGSVAVNVETPRKFEVGEEVPLPSLPTNIKSYTDYRCYGLWYTPHYRLQQASRTDENGLRRFNDDYIVAMGAFYTTSIGDRFKVTLDSGNEFTVILGDGKAPIDCDETNMYAPCFNYDGELCANVLEFIIDSDVMPKSVYSYGSIDCLDEFKGNIVKMVYLGRDNSADWDTYEIR